MIRKLLMVAAAAAVPMGAVAVGAVSAGQAGAGAPPFSGPPITCSFTGLVGFTAPGLSQSGSITTLKTSTTAVTGTEYANCTGGNGQTGPFPGSNLSIISKNTKCPKTNGPVINGTECLKPSLIDDSVSGLATSTAVLNKAIKKDVFDIQGFSFKNKPSSSAFPAPSPACPGEVGFAVAGTLKGKTSTYSAYNLVACLGADTGPGTSGNFATDIGNPSAQITSTTIDPVTSSITLSG